MSEKQRYYEEMIGYIAERYYGVVLDRSKTTEAPLPNVRMDMLFEIPKSALKKAVNSPMPHLKEINLIHIKAIDDTLSINDVVQYLGEIFIIATSSKAKRKTVALTILTTEKISQEIQDQLISPLENTDVSWLYRIKTEVPAYILVIDEMPIDEKRFPFLASFHSLRQIKSKKEYFKKIVNEAPRSKETDLFLFWLRKLYPDFYNKEFADMPVNDEEIVKTLYPNTLEKAEEKGVRKSIFRILKKRFQKVPSSLVDKINEVTSEKILFNLLEKAATVASLKDFEKALK